MKLIADRSFADPEVAARKHETDITNSEEHETALLLAKREMAEAAWCDAQHPHSQDTNWDVAERH
jgi:hypothetical protein